MFEPHLFFSLFSVNDQVVSGDAIFLKYSARLFLHKEQYSISIAENWKRKTYRYKHCLFFIFVCKCKELFFDHTTELTDNKAK